MAMDAFDLAERFQTPVFLMTDLDLGMNNWMADPFPYPDKPLDRGKVLRTKEEFEAHVAKFKEFARYRDVDGDGIPYRTLPGFVDNPAAAYFTRGSGHTDRATYTERPGRLQEQHGPAGAEVRERRARPSRRRSSRARARASAIIAYGSSDFAVEEARAILARKGLTPRLPPAARAARRAPRPWTFIRAHERVYVVDQNRDGQMYDLLRLEMDADCGRLRSIRHYDGFPLDAETVVEGIEAGEKK